MEVKYGYIKVNARMGYWCSHWNDTCMYRVVFMEVIKMTEQWQELKEAIIELRDNDGTGTQQEVCKFLVNYMDVLEKQIKGPQTGHYKDRREQRKVTEAMNSLLLPLLPYFSSETAIIVKRALHLLGEIEIEPQKSEDKCKNCKYYRNPDYTRCHE